MTIARSEDINKNHTCILILFKIFSFRKNFEQRNFVPKCKLCRTYNDKTEYI